MIEETQRGFLDRLNRRAGQDVVELAGQQVAHGPLQFLARISHQPLAGGRVAIFSTM